MVYLTGVEPVFPIWALVPELQAYDTKCILNHFPILCRYKVSIAWLC